MGNQIKKRHLSRYYVCVLGIGCEGLVKFECKNNGLENRLFSSQIISIKYVLVEFMNSYPDLFRK